MMARISRAEREARKRMYDAVIYEIFVTQGWEHISYERLAKELNVSKSTLQGYYPTSTHFSSALQGKVMPLALKQLNLASKELFVESWNHALVSNEQFAMIVKILLNNALLLESSDLARKGLGNIVKILQQNMSREESEQAIREALGDSIMIFMNQ